MRQTVRAVVPFIIALSVLVAPLWSATAADPPIKALMGDNFQHVQVMLYQLMTSNYERLPGDVSAIHDHGQELTTNPPADLSGAAQRTFVAYAYQLENAATNMQVLLSELLTHDSQQVEAGKLNIDYLRVSVARQFGEVITTCVLCHNQFRRKVIQ